MHWRLRVRAPGLRVLLTTQVTCPKFDVRPAMGHHLTPSDGCPKLQM